MTAPPACAVIIPTYNRGSVLLLCLAALAAQTVPSDDIQIIVADDGSTDETGALVVEWASTASVHVTYFRQENAGANAARNAAIKRATAPILIIINDDTLAVPGLVAAHLALHDQFPEPPICVLGRMTIDPALPPSLFADLHHDAAFKPFAGKPELSWHAFFTCNLSVKRQFLLDHGLFDETLRWHEDIELGERLVPHGMRLLYAEAALGLHHHALSEADYFRIAEREGRSLAVWRHRRQSEHTADNTILNAALRPALRHRLADFVLRGWAMQVALSVARRLAVAQPAVARPIYARIFQRIKRRTFRNALAMN